MRTLCLILLTSSSLLAVDGRDLVRKAVENYQRDAQTALRYTYRTTDVNSKGTEVTETAVVDGTPYERLIGRDGHPLTAEERAREEEKFEKVVRERNSETPEQRRKRLEKYREGPRFLLEAPDAFQFANLGEQILNGRPNWVIRCTPNPIYRPHDLKSRFFTKVEATLWIDREDLRMTKADARITSPIAFGWMVARIGRGGRIEMTQTRVAEDFWMLSNLSIRGTARILLIDTKQIDQVVTFSGFRPITRPPAGHLTRSDLR